MKKIMKKIIVVVLIVVAIVCIVPYPRKVECTAENVQVDGWYLEFLLLEDRFYGTAVIDGHEYKPNDSYILTKVFDDIYMLSVYRYRAETNDIDMQTLYLQSDLKNLYEWD